MKSKKSGKTPRWNQRWPSPQARKLSMRRGSCTDIMRSWRARQPVVLFKDPTVSPADAISAALGGAE